MEEKILTKHPTGKSGVRISKEKYDAMREAILNILRAKREATHAELVSAVESRLRGKFSGSIPWYFESTKLDLEARKVIERVEGPKATTYRMR